VFAAMPAEALAELKALEARLNLVPDFVLAARALIEGKDEESAARPNA
jgi:hypothetical protein